MASEKRERALAEIKAARRRAGQKVSRLERNGVRVRKAELDPRLSNTQLESMTTGQLQAHLRRLNTFTSRSTSYVAGLRGEPLNGNTWRAYQRAERSYNKKSENFYERIRNLNIPDTGKTVEERLGDLRKDRRAGDYRSFGNLERDAGGITDDKSLRKLYRQMAKRADPDYMEKEAQLQRRIINKMLRKTGNKDLIPTMADLNDEELLTLAQYSGFMEALAGSYAMAKSISSDTPRWQSSVYEDNEEKIHDWADWAHRHFADKNEEAEQDSDDSGTTKATKPGRDRYGRFARAGESLPDPNFARDSRGRFAKKRTPRFTPGNGDFNPDYS